MKTVIEMARDQGLPETEVAGVFIVNQDDLGRFAALVRADAIADEREACAQSLDKQADLACDAFDRKWAQEMAAAVRARSNA